jgi:hypothetical protein
MSETMELMERKVKSRAMRPALPRFYCRVSKPDQVGYWHILDNISQRRPTYHAKSDYSLANHDITQKYLRQMRIFH